MMEMRKVPGPASNSNASHPASGCTGSSSCPCFI